MSMISWESVPVKESGDPLIDLSEYGFLLEPAYFRQGLSSEKRMFLRKSVAERLLRVQETLKIYRLKVWDGFRSREVQNNIYQKFWAELKKDHPEWSEDKLKTETGIFVTDAKNPARIPPHATGGAVDLTLADMQGKELDMGTVFDHFGPEAAPYYFDDSSVALISKNRKMLREAMLAQDFCADDSEWWHFDYGNQKWAVQLNKPGAVFGEARDPK